MCVRTLHTRVPLHVMYTYRSNHANMLISCFQASHRPSMALFGLIDKPAVTFCLSLPHIPSIFQIFFQIEDKDETKIQ